MTASQEGGVGGKAGQCVKKKGGKRIVLILKVRHVRLFYFLFKNTLITVISQLFDAKSPLGYKSTRK